MDKDSPLGEQITMAAIRLFYLPGEAGAAVMSFVYEFVCEFCIILMEGPQRAKFQLNKIDISKLGFDLSSDKALVNDFVSPFEEDQGKPHPLCTQIPEGFTTFQFQLEKVANRLPEESFIYIFYNIIDERLQLQAARSLMDKGLNYHKKHKIWVRKREGKFEYFNIVDWKYLDFTEPVQDEDYYTKQDFADRTND